MYGCVKDKNMIQSVLVVLIVGTSLGYFLSEINKSCIHNIRYTILYKDIIFNIVIWFSYLLYFIIKICWNIYIKRHYVST
jgi:hypothetical protein